MLMIITFVLNSSAQGHKSVMFIILSQLANVGNLVLLYKNNYQSLYFNSKIG